MTSWTAYESLYKFNNIRLVWWHTPLRIKECFSETEDVLGTNCINCITVRSVYYVRVEMVRFRGNISPSCCRKVNLQQDVAKYYFDDIEHCLLWISQWEIHSREVELIFVGVSKTYKCLLVFALVRSSGQFNANLRLYRLFLSTIFDNRSNCL